MLHIYHKIKGIDKKYGDVLQERYKRIKQEECEMESFLKECKKKVKVFDQGSKAHELKQLLDHVEIKCDNDRFFYSIDVFKTWYILGMQINNSTIDYSKIVYGTLDDLIIQNKNNNFVKENNKTVHAIKGYLFRCVDYVQNSQLKNKDNILHWLENIVQGESLSLEEALQRILFLNMIQWQTQHRLVGLGRLDKLLDKVYQYDKKNNNLSNGQTLSIIKDFCIALHKYYWFKSDALMGDTGQIIVLGGKQEDDTYFCNELTYAFIQAIKELQIPDPKLLLRSAKDMPLELMEAAVECIGTGIGSPLLSNDELVVPNMQKFGYEKNDAYNYVTSACWEPLVPANSHEQNNIGLINFLLPFELISEKEGYSQITNFDELYERYIIHLEGHIIYICSLLNEIRWAKDPLLSAFTESCQNRCVDISDGGGKYNNYGILSLAMSNTVNAFFNIKKYVFDDKIITLQQLDFLKKNNFRGHDEIRKILVQQKFFGTDNLEVIRFTNRLFDDANKIVGKYCNKYGGRAKFGLSSPGYIIASKDFPASFDGRRFGEPFAVHISADGNISYSELMNFAVNLDYSDTKFNGNVLDFFVSPNMLEDNKKKFVSFLMKSLEIGIFQMQINVVKSETLIAAKSNPEKYKDLIVRVWGFNAYFIELPEEYKDYLISRALQNERAS